MRQSHTTSSNFLRRTPWMPILGFVVVVVVDIVVVSGFVLLLVLMVVLSFIVHYYSIYCYC